MSLKLLVKDEPPSVMTRVLRMERLVKEGTSAGRHGLVEKCENHQQKTLLKHTIQGGEAP